jgi:hypothetical protein
MSKELDEFLALEAELNLPEAHVLHDIEIVDELDWLLTIAELNLCGLLYHKDGNA